MVNSIVDKAITLVNNLFQNMPFRNTLFPKKSFRANAKKHLRRDQSSNFRMENAGTGDNSANKVYVSRYRSIFAS